MSRNQNILTGFIKSSGIFIIGNVLSKAIVFFLLPVYTRYLRPEQYGYYDVSVAYVTLLTSLLFICVWDGTMRFMYDGSDITHKMQAVLSGWSIFGASGVLYIIASIILFRFTDIQYLGLILLHGIALNIQQMYAYIARGYGKNADFALSGILNALVMMGGNILLIILFGFDISALYISSILGNAVQCLYLALRLKLPVRASYNGSLTKSMLAYTLPLCVNAVSGWFLLSYNRIVISKIMTICDNGVYAVGSNLGKAFAVITTCFTFAWQEIVFSRGNDSEDSHYYSEWGNYYLIFLGFGVMLLLPALSVAFPLLVGEQYLAAKPTLPLILIYSLAMAYSLYLGNIFQKYKKTNLVFISTLASCIVNVAACGPLIRIWGLNGASAAILLSYLINDVIRYILLRRIGFKLKVSHVLAVCGCISASTFIFFMFGRTVNLIWLLLCCAGIFLIYRTLIINTVKSLLER